MDGGCEIPPLTGQVLADEPDQGGGGAVAFEGRLHRYAVAHRGALRMSKYAHNQGDRQVAQRLKHCGHWLCFRDYFTVGQVRLHAADFCKLHLLCPLCAIRRGAKATQAYMDRVGVVLAQRPALRPYMVTLTVKDGPFLADRFRHLRGGVRSMLQARRDHVKFPSKNRHVEAAKAAGGVYSIEVKRGSGSGEWHPHVHMIWLCDEPPDEQQLSVEWKHWTGDSHVVDVRPFCNDDDALGGFLEVFKYALKFADLGEADNWHAYETLRGKRLVDAFGLLRGVDVPDSLADEPLDGLPYVELLYKWFNDSYGLRRVLTDDQAAVPDSEGIKPHTALCAALAQASGLIPSV